MMYWKEEEGVSVHPQNEVKCVDYREGEFCTVAFGKTNYSGLIACCGN